MAFRVNTALRNALLGTTGFETAMLNGVIAIYSGSQPASADAAETGTLLCLISNGSATYTPGSTTAGLQFNTPSGGSITNSSSQVWSGTATNTGTAGWYRFYDSTFTTGASTTTCRLDGLCGTTGSQFVMSSTSIVTGTIITVNSATYTLPTS